MVHIDFFKKNKTFHDITCRMIFKKNVSYGKIIGGQTCTFMTPKHIYKGKK